MRYLGLFLFSICSTFSICLSQNAFAEMAEAVTHAQQPNSQTSSQKKRILNKSVCVQSFNVYAPAYARNKEVRLKKLGQVLAQENPLCDAIQLQEIWKEEQYHWVRELLEPKRYAGTQADIIRGDDRITGLAGFYQGHVLAQESILYGVNNKDGLLDWFRERFGVSKAFALNTVKLDASNSAVLFLNTHTHPTNEAIRIAQVLQMIENLFARMPIEKNILFAADMNATPSSLEYDLLRHVLLLRDSFLDANASYGDICTYCGKNPLSWSRENRVIDYVLYKNLSASKWDIAKSEVNLKEAGGAPLSDHYGVRSTFTVKENSAPITLGARDPEYLRRIATALDVLERARAVLVKERERFLEGSVQSIDRLRAKLLVDSEESPLHRYFRTL